MKERKSLRDSLFVSVIILGMLNACAARRPNGGNAGTNRIHGIKFGHFVSLGMQKIKIGEVCALFGAALSSGTFFDNLTRVDDGKPHFSSDGMQVDSFPDEVFVGITGIPVKCSISPAESMPIEADEKLRSALTFQVFWHDGQNLNAVTGLAVAVVEPKWRELGTDWAYEVSFRGTDIPLTATLVIQIWTKDGKELAQFDGHL